MLSGVILQEMPTKCC